MADQQAGIAVETATTVRGRPGWSRREIPGIVWGERGRPGRRFLTVLLLISLFGLGLRYVALATAEPCRQPNRFDLSAALLGKTPGHGECVLITDAPVYHEQAISNAEGHWWETAELNEAGDRQPSALHPPLYALFLSGFTMTGVDDFDLLRALAVVLALGTISLSGLCARRYGGDRVGLIAAVLVAVHPMVWINDIVLMSEALFALWVPLVAWAGLVAWERRDKPSAAILGVSIGIAALTRSEAILLVGVVGVPLLLGAGRHWRPAAWSRLGVVALAAGLTVLPWVGANLLRFNEPVLFTTTAGFSTAFANCEAVYEPGPLLGTRSPECLLWSTAEYTRRAGPHDDQSNADAVLVESARREIGDDPAGATRAGVARVGRMWGLYRPFESIRQEEPLERRGVGRSQLAVVVGWAVMALGAWGAWLLRRRRLPISPLVGWVVTSSVVAFVDLGLHRFRASSDVALCILAAVAVDQALTRWWPRDLASEAPGTSD